MDWLPWLILAVAGLAIAIIVGARWLYRKLRHLQRQTFAFELRILLLSEERTGLQRHIADLNSRLELRTREYQTAAEALREATIEIERLSEALRSLQTQHLDPPLPPKGIGPVRRP
jgi:C4-dicarboxylate-specific signal transduction histidine kinase